MNDWPRFMNNYSVRDWGERLMSTHFSFCFISLSYLGHTLFCCTPLIFCFCFSCFFAFCFSLSPLSYYLCFCHSAPWCHFFPPLLSHSALHICPSPNFFFFLCTVYTPRPPYSPPGFLSWLTTLHKLKNWYMCYKSIVSHWARRWVQSEPLSITQISHRARALATHCRPNSRSAGALISRTCFSCNIRAVSRSTHWG